MTRQQAENLNLAECTDAEFEEWLTEWRPKFEEEWLEFSNDFLRKTTEKF